MKRHISIFKFLVCAFAACSLAQNAYSEDFAIIADEQMSVSYFINEQLHGSYTLTNPVSWPEEYYYSWVPLQPTHVLTAESHPGKRFGWYTLAQNDPVTVGENTSPSKCSILLTTELSITASLIKTAKTSAHFGNGYVICPKYEDIKFDLGFDGNGATSGDMSGKTMTGLTIDDEFSLPANAYEKTGYHFTGWKTNETKGVTFKDKAQVKGAAFWNGKSFDSTLYAQWAANAYTVTFNGNGGGSPSPASKSVTYDSTYGDLATCSRTGHDFAGWYTAASGGTKVEATTKVTITADQTLYAHWTAKTYTVTFNGNGGNAPSKATQTVTYNSTYGSLATCTRTGYAFAGWWTEASGGTEVKADTNVTITDAQTLYAHWTPVTYTISYGGLKEGSTHSGNPMSYTIESDDITFNSASDTTVYKFNGWSPATLRKGSTGNQTVTANYLTKVDHPVATTPLIYNGSVQSCASSTTEYQVKDNQQTVPGQYMVTFTLYNGYCWNDENGSVAPYSVPWEIQKADLTGVKVGQSGSLVYTGEAQTPAVFHQATAVGGQSVTWTYSASGSAFSPTLPSFTEAGSYTVSYKAEANNHNTAEGTFTVTIERARAASVAVSPSELPYTKKEQGPAVTARNCSTSGDLRATDIGTYRITATPKTNYAWSNGGTEERTFEWSIVDSSYTIEFDGAGGAGSMEPVTLVRDEPYVVANAFTKKGCEFVTWRTVIGGVETNFDVGVTVSNLTTEAGSVITFTADWLGRYTVAFDKGEGDDITGTMTNVTYEADREYQLPSNAFTRSGYHFTGWATNGTDVAFTDCAVVSNLAEPGGTCTLVAQWKEISLAEAMHCTNLVWESVTNANHSSRIGWTGVYGEDEGFEGSGSCARQPKPTETGIPQMLTAKLVESGTLSFRWKGLAVRFNISQKRDDTTTAVLTLRAPRADEWNYFSTNLVLTTERWVHIWNFTPDEAADIDQMTWTPEGAHPEPGTVVTNAMPVAITGLVYNGSERIGVEEGDGYTIVGNVATNAGEYTAVATPNDGFVWEGGSSDPANIAWTIAKATVEMGGVTLTNGTYEADGTAKSIFISGALPPGVTVAYEGNGQTEPGTYTVTAKFAGDAKNYEAIPDKTATLTLLEPFTGQYTIHFKVPDELEKPGDMNCVTGKVYNLPALPSEYKWRRTDAGGRLYDGGVLVFDLIEAPVLELEAVKVP